MNKVPKIGDLYPDGVTITVDWDAMDVEMSVFIPCIDSEKAKEQVKKVAKGRGWKMKYQARIEDARFGLRVWRLS